MLLAFHNNSQVKEFYLNRVRHHRVQDEIIQGTYWKEGKGCAVGCTLHSSNHRSYEIELGIPELLAHLQDAIFEYLPPENAKEFPEKFLEAIPVGADLGEVWSKFALWLLVDPERGVVTYFTPGGEQDKITRTVARLIENGGTCKQFHQAASIAVEDRVNVIFVYYIALVFAERRTVFSGQKT